MGAFIYRRLPYPDVPFRLEDGRTIYQVTHQYEKPRRQTPGLDKYRKPYTRVSVTDDCFKVVDARPGEIFTADFFNDGRTETEIHEHLNQLLEVGQNCRSRPR